MTLRTNDNGTDRDMTEQEQLAHLKYAKVLETETKAKAKTDADKQAARQIVLNKLGLTADEVAALLG